MSITVHALYYGPVGKNGLSLKTSPAVRSGSVISDDQQTDIYTMTGKDNESVVSSELLYTPNGPVIRATIIKSLQGHDKRTSPSCNKTLMIQLSDISNLLLPLLYEETTFPIKEIKLTVKKEG